MVKFMLPGNDRSRVRICGGFYIGGIVYDNKALQLPLKEIEMFIIDENKDVKSKGEVKEESKEVEVPKDDSPKVAEPKVAEVSEDLEALGKHLADTMTVKELKAVAKVRGISGFSTMKEAELVDALIKDGYKG